MPLAAGAAVDGHAHRVSLVSGERLVGASRMSLRGETWAMDVIRFGLGMRALRRRRGWTQQRLAVEARVSRGVVGRIERGRADRVPVHVLVRVAAALGATVSTRLLWHGEGLDRLLDADHALIGEAALGLLDSLGWETAPEVSFNIRGERGAIDILAFHAATGSLLVIEIKTVVPDLQAMLGTLDRKARLAVEVARARGWEVRTVSRVLVLPDDRTARRRVVQHAATFAAALPARTVAVRRWLRAPVGTLSGILFLTGVHQVGVRHRVPGRRTRGAANARTPERRLGARA
ncbi:MAG: helix-turn-helix transcriptional regulator [Chloroflexota bacterium]